MPGDRLTVCRKAMGLKKGEKRFDLGVIKVTSVRREPLNAIDQAGCDREGFPHMTPAEFVAFFVASHRGATPKTEITVICFEVEEYFY